MDIANLIIRVTNDGLSAAQRELRRLRDEASRTSDANKKLADGFGEMAKWSAIGLGVLGGGVALATKKAMAFETAMAEVNKTVDFAASDGLANLKSELLDLSKVIPLTFEELAAVTASGGQLGVAEKDLKDFTETVAKMAIAFDMSAADAGDAMAKLANVFEIPISEIDRLGDAINTLSNNSPAKAAEIVNALSRVGGMAKAFGLTSDAAAALTATFIAMGKPAEVAASAVNSMLTTFSTLDMATKSQIIGFQKLGVDIDEFAQRVKVDGKAAIYEFLEAVNELPKADRIGAIASIMGKEYGDDVTMLAGNMSLLNAQMALVGETADSTKNYVGSMQTEFEKMAATSENGMTLFSNRIDAATASIGEAFIPALNDLLTQVAPVIDSITTWAQANPELIKQIVVVTASVLGSIVAIKLFADGIAMAVTTVENLKTAFNLAKIGLTALASPIGLTVIALTALVVAGVLVYQNWDTIKAKAIEIWGAIGSFIGGTIDSIKSYFSNTFPLLTSIVSAQFDAIKNVVMTVLGVIKAIISGDFGAIPNIIGEGLRGAIAIVKGIMSDVLGAIKDAGAKLFNIGRDFIQGFINGIKSIGSSVVGAASSMVGSAIAAVKKKQDSASPSKVTTKLGGDFSQGMANGIKKGAKAVKTEAQRMVEQAIDATKNSIASLQKEIALFGDDSPLASFDFDVNAGKYAGVDPRLIAQNRELIIQYQSLVDLDKQRTESTKALATAREAIQSRFEKMQEYKDSTKTDLQGMLGGIEEEDPLTKLQNQYEERMSVIEKYEQMHTDMLGVQAEARLAVEQSYMNAKRDLMLGQGEALFGDLAGIAKAFAGEQSGIYRAMFAVEKGFAIAQSAIAIQQSVAKAMALGFPQNIPVIGAAVAQGATLLSTIKGIQPQGFKQGGYTGNTGSGQVAGVVHGQEYVFDAASTKRIGVDNLNAMRSGKAANDSGVQITINNNSSARVETSSDGQTITITDVRNEVKRGFTNLQNPNSYESKQINRNVQAPRRR